MKVLKNGIECELTPDEEAEFLATLPTVTSNPVESASDRRFSEPMIAAGFKALGFTDGQIDAFFAAASKV